MDPLACRIRVLLGSRNGIIEIGESKDAAATEGRREAANVAFDPVARHKASAADNDTRQRQDHSLLLRGRLAVPSPH